MHSVKIGLPVTKLYEKYCALQSFNHVPRNAFSAIVSSLLFFKFKYDSFDWEKKAYAYISTILLDWRDKRFNEDIFPMALGTEVNFPLWRLRVESLVVVPSNAFSFMSCNDEPSICNSETLPFLKVFSGSMVMLESRPFAISVLTANLEALKTARISVNEGLSHLKWPKTNFLLT